MSEEATVLAARGDRRAFSTLYETHRPAIVGRLVSLLGRGPVIDDLVQDTFLRAYQALPTFRGECPFRFWLLRIATHAALAEHRRTRRSIWRLFAADEEERSRARSTPAEAETCELIAVHAALDRLPPKLREAVILYELEGRTLDEIAVELDAPLATVAARVRRGRERLKLVLALLCALVFSATWAFRATPKPALLLEDEAPVRVIPLVHTTSVPRAKPPKKDARPAKRAVDPPIVTDEPLGDVITVTPPLRRDPLFDVEEYKSRGKLVP